MTTLFLLVFSFFNVKAISGLGVVITIENDTLSGQVYHRGFDKMIKVTLVQNGVETDFSPQQIAKFIVGEQQWESIHLAKNGSRPDQHIFLKVLAQGRNQLLKGRYIVDGCGCDDFPKNALATGHFIKREDGKVTQVFLKPFKLLDDPEYVSQFIAAPQLSKGKWISLRKLKAVLENT